MLLFINNKLKLFIIISFIIKIYMYSNKRGILIVFEGSDRTGKSTQSIIIKNTLKELGYNVLHLNFPDRSTMTGNIIDKYLKNDIDLNSKACHLLFSANRWEKYDLIKNSLLNGYIVILDRYIYSGLAYSIAKGEDLNWCKNSDIGLVEPDLIIYLDPNLKEDLFNSSRLECFDLPKSKLDSNLDSSKDSFKSGLLDSNLNLLYKRLGFGQERYEVIEIQSNIRNAYKIIIIEFNHLKWKIIDANRSINSISDSIFKKVNKMLIN